MKHALIIAMSLTLSQPAHAQIAAPEDLLEKLEELTKPLMPLLRDLEDTIRDIPSYHPPEVLPNGDIIIRRKPNPDELSPAPNQEAPQTEPLDL